jgi:coproporphyrinogen III oxidase-like Fe-S oxidoreductase
MRSWDAYIEAVAAARLPVEGEESVGPEEVALERVWLRLRTEGGYPLGESTAAQCETAAEWVRFGWARTDDDRLRLTAEGWLLLDRLALEWSSGIAAAS